MTTKKKAQGGSKGKGKPEDNRSPEELMCVSVEGAEYLIDTIRGGGGPLYEDDEVIGAFLLLLHSIAYADDNMRFNYINSAERMLLPYTSAFDEAGDKVREEAACALARAALGKGGGR